MSQIKVDRRSTALQLTSCRPEFEISFLFYGIATGAIENPPSLLPLRADAVAEFFFRLYEHERAYSSLSFFFLLSLIQ